MEEVNTFLEGFKALTTPYDKVDTSILSKRNVLTAINQLKGGAEDDAPADAGEPPAAAEEPPADAGEAVNRPVEENNVTNNQEQAKTEKKSLGGILAGKYKDAALASAQADESDKGTDPKPKKSTIKKIIKVGTIIVYILIFPLMPWYYIMKYTLEKMKILYNRVISPL